MNQYLTKLVVRLDNAFKQCTSDEKMKKSKQDLEIRRDEFHTNNLAKKKMSRESGYSKSWLV